MSALSPDVINAIAGVGTFVLLAATTIAALIQLRHVRAGNELAALLSIERDFRTADIQAAFRYVQHELPIQIEDAGYRAQLSALGYIDPHSHPEMIVCNWFDRTGTFIRAGFVKEELFLDTFGRLIGHYWQLLAPVIAVLRRRRGNSQYAAFEYLAYRAQIRTQLRQTRGERSTMKSMAVDDPWLADDSQPL